MGRKRRSGRRAGKSKGHSRKTLAKLRRDKARRKKQRLKNIKKQYRGSVYSRWIAMYFAPCLVPMGEMSMRLANSCDCGDMPATITIQILDENEVHEFLKEVFCAYSPCQRPSEGLMVYAPEEMEELRKLSAQQETGERSPVPGDYPMLNPPDR